MTEDEKIKFEEKITAILTSKKYFNRGLLSYGSEYYDPEPCRRIDIIQEMPLPIDPRDSWNYQDACEFLDKEFPI